MRGDLAKKYVNTIGHYVPAVLENGFLEWLKTTDFETAPASTKFYNSYEGGWLEHTIKVLERLIKEVKNEYGEDYSVYSKESVCKVALLHDIYKLDYYEKYNRNVKDNEGKWTTVTEYKVKDDTFVYGTPGDNSVRIAERFFDLTDEEAVAIKYAYGDEDRATLHKVNKKYPLALFLQTAINKTIDIDT